MTIKETNKTKKKLLENSNNKRIAVFVIAIIIVILLTVGLAYLIKNLSSNQTTNNNQNQEQQKNEPRPIIITGKIVQVAQDKIIVNDRKNKRTEIFFEAGVEPKITGANGELKLEDLKTNQDITVYAKEKDGVAVIERIRTKDQKK